MLKPGGIGLRVSTVTTSPYSNGMGWPTLSLKYTATFLKLVVFMGMNMRFGKSVVVMASLDWFFTDIHRRRGASVSPTTTFLTISLYTYTELFLKLRAVTSVLKSSGSSASTQVHLSFEAQLER